MEDKNNGTVDYNIKIINNISLKLMITSEL